MNAARETFANPDNPSNLPWYRGLTGYHWFVLMTCWMAWFFDTMDQQLFVLARASAMKDLMGPDMPKETVKFYSGLATAILMLGWATGGIVFGILGDRWGRAKTMITAIFMYSIFTGLSALSVTWVDFSLYRFLTGMGVGGTFAAAVSLVADVMPARSRPFALGFVQAMAAIGNMTAACISFIIPPGIEIHGLPGWRLLFVVGVLPALLVLLVMRKLKEPEAWVKAKAEAKSGQGGKGKDLGSVRELFGDPRWRRRVIVGIVLGLAGIMGLWGIGFWLPELVRDVVPGATPDQKKIQDWYCSLAMLLFNGGAFVGTNLFSILTSRVGRRPAFAAIFVLAIASVVGVFGFMTQPSQVWWMAPLLGLGTLTVFGGYSIYFPELFPTRLRATGTGFCYNTARYVAATAPFTLGSLASAFAAPAGSARAAEGLSKFTFLSSIGGADDPIRYAAMVVASVFVLGLLILPFAPETKGKPLPE